MRLSWIAALLMVTAVAGAEPMRILAVEEPPASFSDANGEAAGLAVDFLREIQRRVGNSDPVTIAPESRVYQSGLRLPNVVLLSFSRTPEREASFHWIARIIHKPWVLYGRPDSGLKIGSLDDMRKLRAIAVVGGDIRGRWLREQGFTNLVETEGHTQGLRLLLAQRVDATFSEPQGIAYACHRDHCGDKPPLALWSPRASDVWIMMSKRGTSPATAQRWQAAAEAAMADGTFAKLARHWADESQRRFGIRAQYRNGALDFCSGTAGC